MILEGTGEFSVDTSFDLQNSDDHGKLTNIIFFSQGVLKVNQFIEVRPGIVTKDASGNSKCSPIYSRVVSLFAEQNELQFAVPGGLIGVGTTMDPSLTRGDKLVGQVLGSVGSLPDIFIELEVYNFSFQM